LYLVGFLSSRFTHDARSQEHKASTLNCFLTKDSVQVGDVLLEEAFATKSALEEKKNSSKSRHYLNVQREFDIFC